MARSPAARVTATDRDASAWCAGDGGRGLGVLRKGAGLRADGHGEDQIRRLPASHVPPSIAVDHVSLRLKAWDLPVSAQITHAAGLEAMTLCRGAALTIENAGDHSVGIKSGQSANERDCALVGTHRSWP
jgi:hypothetical protein